jgi:cell division transport system permease protein
MKLSGLRYLGKQGFENVWKNRMMAFASFCVLLVSLLLVGLSILLFMNLNSIIGGIENSQLSLDAAAEMIENAKKY